MQSWIRSAQDRKLDRLAAAYAVAGWLLVQGASIAFPLFGAPQWALRALIAVALIGFPLTLGVAWLVVPHPHRSQAHAHAKQADTTLILLLGALVFLSVAQLSYEFWRAPSASGRPQRTASPAAELQPPPLPPAASIAVLPFLNMSGDPNKEYFSDGVSEELLNDLANVPDLQVAARTSSFVFKGRSEDIRQIARTLNVRAVLEGSVRESGSHVRITAQLINAADGYHLWSQTYDRDLSDILVVQDDAARAITAALTNKLLGHETDRALRKPMSIDPEIYRKYLEARSQYALKTDAGDQKAIALLKIVTARQPDFAPAFTALGLAYIHRAELQEDPAALNGADSALQRALSLDPDSPDALSAQLTLKLQQWDWDAAAKNALRLQTISPHGLATLTGLEFYYVALGFVDREIEVQRELIARDPLDFVDLNNLAAALDTEAKYADAAIAAQASLRLRPDRPLALYTLCLADAGLNRQKEAQALAKRLTELKEPGASDSCGVRIAAASGQLQDASRLADKLAKEFPSFVLDETSIGDAFAVCGDMKDALVWYERGYDRRNRDLFATQFAPTTPPALLETEGWKALMQRPLARDWMAARDRALKELKG